jgi:hypothetical protein
MHILSYKKFVNTDKENIIWHNLKRLGTYIMALKFHLIAQRYPYTTSNPRVFNLFWQRATAIVMD